MRRLAPTLAGIAAVVAALAIPMGAGGGTSAYSLLAAGGVGLIAWRLAGRSGSKTDPGWLAPPTVTFVPAGPRPPATPAAVALALGRVEARELATSGSMGVGIGFSVVVLLLFGFVWADDYLGDAGRYAELLPIFVHPLVGLTVLGAHRARTRSRRDETEELFTSCPTTDATRTVAHLTTGWVSAAAALLTAGALLVAVRSTSELNVGSFGARQWALVLGVAVLGLGGAALGVALARWAPWSLIPVVAVIGIAFLTAAISSAGSSTSEPLRQLSTWLGDPDVDIRFTAPHWLAHHLWLAALVGLVATIAMLRDRRDRWTGGAGVALAILATGAAYAATRPMDADDARRIASLVAEPEQHQVCSAAGVVEVCAYRGDDALAPRYASELAPVVAAIPPDALEGWSLRQGADVDRRLLSPEVRSLLPAHDGVDRLIPGAMLVNDDSYEGARFWTALAAVEVLDEHRPGAPVDLRGQARGVVALWAATRGTSDEQVQQMTSFVADVSEGQAAHRPWPDPCTVDPAPVQWALSDLEAARALSGLPDDEVGAVLADGWDRFLDPATSTDALLGAVGLEPLGEPIGETRTDGC